MAEKSKSDHHSDTMDKEFQVRLCTKLESLSVADTPFTVPAIINPEGLNTFVKELLEKTDDNDDSLEFDWLCLGEIIRGSLQAHVDKRNDITAETVLELEYIEKRLPPEPQVSGHKHPMRRCMVPSGGLHHIECNAYFIRLCSSKAVCQN